MKDPSRMTGYGHKVFNGANMTFGDNLVDPGTDAGSLDFFDTGGGHST